MFRSPKRPRVKKKSFWPHHDVQDLEPVLFEPKSESNVRSIQTTEVTDPGAHKSRNPKRPSRASSFSCPEHLPRLPFVDAQNTNTCNQLRQAERVKSNKSSRLNSKQRSLLVWIGRSVRRKWEWLYYGPDLFPPVMRRVLHDLKGLFRIPHPIAITNRPAVVNGPG